MKKDVDGGFSLIEGAVAIIILGIFLSYAMPVFLYSTLRVSRSAIQLGSNRIAERIVEDVVAQKISTLPTSGTIDAFITEPDRLNFMGRSYVGKIIYCSGTFDICNATRSQFKVEIYYKDLKTYELEISHTEAR
jgi:prepilin-type N-terminal cleavage/methylation domain-containing protein